VNAMIFITHSLSVKSAVSIFLYSINNDDGGYGDG